MFLRVEKPLVGELVSYRGIYCPRDNCILVRVSSVKKLLAGSMFLALSFYLFLVGVTGPTALYFKCGLIVLWLFCGVYEKWHPRFQADRGAGLDDQGGLIEFEGLAGSFGEAEIEGMDRIVEITRVLRFDPDSKAQASIASEEAPAQFGNRR